jgi:hypothetical protein
VKINFLRVVLLAGWLARPAGGAEECTDNTRAHSALLDPPASAQDVRFQRCSDSERVIYRIRRAYPGDELVESIGGRWKEKGWLPSIGGDSDWGQMMSKDRLRVARVRKIQFENSKGHKATLMLAYHRVFQEPILEGLPSEQLDFGSDLHVEARLLSAPAVTPTPPSP